jgi:phosphoenolpyruvate carboxykinase (ATP)
MSDILKKLKLEQYGIRGVTEVVYNPSYEQLYKEELDPTLEGFEVGILSEFGAVKVPFPQG